jgi:hypothetical protein
LQRISGNRCGIKPQPIVVSAGPKEVRNAAHRRSTVRPADGHNDIR